jgi:urate oxidase
MAEDKVNFYCELFKAVYERVSRLIACCFSKDGDSESIAKIC